jgi:hypothetical protein
MSSTDILDGGFCMALLDQTLSHESFCSDSKVVLSFSCFSENHRMAAWHLREAIKFHELAAVANEIGNLSDMHQNKEKAKFHHQHAFEYSAMAEIVLSNLE